MEVALQPIGCANNHSWTLPATYEAPEQCDGRLCVANASFALLEESRLFMMQSAGRMFGSVPVSSETASVRLVFDDSIPTSVQLFYALGCQPRPLTQVAPVEIVDNSVAVLFDNCNFNLSGTLFVSFYCAVPPCAFSMRTQVSNVAALNATTKISYPQLAGPFMQLFRLDTPFIVPSSSSSDKITTVVSLQVNYSATNQMVEPKPWPHIRIEGLQCPSAEPSAAWTLSSPTKTTATSALYVISGNETSSPIYLRVEVLPSACRANPQQCQHTPLLVSVKTITPSSSNATEFIVLTVVISLVLLIILAGAAYHFFRLYRKSKSLDSPTHGGETTYSLLDVEENESDLD